MKSLPLTILLCLFAVDAEALFAEDKDSAGVTFFETKIRPVLVERCYKCHSADAKDLQGGLRLDSREGILQGGESGPAIVPGKADESLLLSALRHELLEMPPDERLPDRIVADFEKWIQIGAPDPREEKPSTTASTSSNEDIDFPAARQYWAFQTPTRHDPPAVKGETWPQRTIDRFVLVRLEAAGLVPNDAADRRTLIRRLYFVAVGLPPETEAVAKFIADESPDAYARLVDELLSSPHYGERWARLWLDVARYAEDQAHIVGNNSSLFYPNAYLYRDWVIAALNRDLPYDQFVRLQLAADLLEPPDEENRVALGFIGLGPKYYRRGDPEVMAEEWSDRVDTVTRGLLGLTVACARCHDHKYDPIPTEDYYALAGVFAGTEMFNQPLDPKREKNKDGQAKKPADALHVVRDKEPRNLPVYIRGNVKNHGPTVERGYVQVLSADERLTFSQGSGRRELAEAIVDRGNPLTARVIVNRIWAAHFGRPLVATPSNFGNLGQRPTHPELLDDLAVRFMENGWSLKWLHREILLSATWRQSSHIDSGKLATDPENKLIGRMHRRRLDAETWRDALLAVTGRLDSRIGGPSVDPQDPEERRRTVYSQVSRLELNPMLAMFDFPDPNAHAEKRVETITPLQKLFVLNSPFMVRQAKALAEWCLSQTGDDANRIQAATQILYGREATDEEVQLGLAFLGKPDQEHASRWEQYAHVLLASNELLFID